MYSLPKISVNAHQNLVVRAAARIANPGMAMPPANFNAPSVPTSSPIHERVQPHIIHTTVHTGVASPGLTGNEPTPSNNAPTTLGLGSIAPS
jgi:hypothetical protein